jgi:hypothetical protein
LHVSIGGGSFEPLDASSSTERLAFAEVVDQPINTPRIRFIVSCDACLTTDPEYGDVNLIRTEPAGEGSRF